MKAKVTTARGSSSEREISSFNQQRDWQISFSLKMSSRELLTMLSTASTRMPVELAKLQRIRVHSTST